MLSIAKPLKDPVNMASSAAERTYYGKSRKKTSVEDPELVT